MDAKLCNKNPKRFGALFILFDDILRPSIQAKSFQTKKKHLRWSGNNSAAQKMMIIHRWNGESLQWSTLMQVETRICMSEPHADSTTSRLVANEMRCWWTLDGSASCTMHNCTSHSTDANKSNQSAARCEQQFANKFNWFASLLKEERTFSS